ncbi:MAG: methylmalonyl Co-A mutase-associated GTPase MeaB [Methylobacteriaceae bacterium]|nr:methylmalonyl Co-A mutase-associated GTPase MeaB [Methylobacteriaceae bacterium]
MTARPAPPVELADLARRVAARERAALARAITLIESRRADHRARAEDLVQALLPATGQAIRVGITGVPGVGKSTTIDAFGAMLTGRGHRVAVLAVDPSSSRSGGSILGDKTRMQRLSADAAAFIRPSPAAGALGGVAARTRESILVCEAAGFDVVLVETVGVGQSETAVADMTDFFLFLALPGAGDELQGVKKGVLELADMIAVNKADGDNLGRARHAAGDYRAALHILNPGSPNWRPPVILISGLMGEGLEAMWTQILEHRRIMQASGEFAARRRDQQVRWMRELVEARLRQRLYGDAEVKRRLASVEADVAAGRLTPAKGAEALTRLAGL